MDNNQNTPVWNAQKTSADQGLIIEEGTGRNVAVTYDAKDAPLVAAAPELLDALIECYSHLNQVAFVYNDKLASIALRKAQDAIQKAKGE